MTESGPAAPFDPGPSEAPGDRPEQLRVLNPSQCLRLSGRFDTAGGMTLKLKTVKLLGEKLPAVQFKSGQDDGFGFFNAGLRMDLDWEVRATYAFPKS